MVVQHHLRFLSLSILSALCISTNSFAAKRVLNQNGCIAVMEAHPKQRYPFVYLIQTNEKSVRAKVLFRNPDTWQIRLEGDCDWDWIGTPTFAMMKTLPDPEELDGDDSTGREGQMLSFGVETGMALSPLPTYGVYTGYFLTEDDLFEFSYVTGALDILLFKIEGTLITGRYKRFWGNSFYTNMGVGQRTFNASSPLINSLSGSSTFDATVQALVLDFAIGNKWQWDTFHIGCDWVGMQIPLGEPQTTFKTDSSSTSDQDKSKKEDSLYATGKASSTSLLRLQIGFAF